MKRFGILILLACVLMGQSIWLASPDVAFAQDDVQVADDGATQTAQSGAAETAAAEQAAAQATQASLDATANAVAAFQTQAAVDATTVADAANAAATNAAGAAQTSAAGTQTAEAVGVADEAETQTAIASSTPVYKNIYPGDWVRVNTSILNVRPGPTMSGSAIGQVTRNQEFQVLEGPIEDGSTWWIRIDMGTPVEDPRWISANFVVRLDGPSPPTSTATNTPPASSTPATYQGIVPGDTIRVNASSLNVRSSASTSGTVVAVIRRNEQYAVLAGPVSANGFWWVRIDMGSNISGQRWIAANYVVKVTPVSSPTPSNTPLPTNTPSPTATIDPSASPTATGTATFTPTHTSTPSGTVTAGTYLAGEKVAISTSVNVRSGPSTSNGVLRVASRGAQGTVVTGNTRGGSYTWIQVNFGSTTGWVATNYVTHLQLTTPTTAPGAWLLQVSLDCYSTPERITLVNSSSSAAEIYSIRTHFDAGSNEPFVVNHTLAANQTRSYLAGTGASGSFALTTAFIFTNSAGAQDGVTIETSFGTITRSCPASSTGERYVVVDLSEQYMTVYQGSVVVAGTYVSTGRAGFATPIGTFRTWIKYVNTRMSGCSNGECWDTPNVPYSQFFTYNGHALHGAYWHNQFGQVRSHGCVNLPVPFSEWLYYWLPLNSRVVVRA